MADPLEALWAAGCRVIPTSAGWEVVTENGKHVATFRNETPSPAREMQAFVDGMYAGADTVRRVVDNMDPVEGLGQAAQLIDDFLRFSSPPRSLAERAERWRAVLVGALGRKK